MVNNPLGDSDRHYSHCLLTEITVHIKSLKVLELTQTDWSLNLLIIRGKLELVGFLIVGSIAGYGISLGNRVFTLHVFEMTA